MKPRECGFANPPADGTTDRERVDRFVDFLHAAGPAPKKGEPLRCRTPAQRYHLRFLAWRMGQVHPVGVD